MAESSHPDSDSQWRRTWLVFGLLVGIHAGFQLLLNPLEIAADDTGVWLGVTLMGFLICQPILFGIWAALGPGRLIRRGSLAFASLTAVTLAGTTKRWNVWWPTDEPSSIEAEILLWVSGFFVFAMGTMLLARKFAGWQITLPSAEASATQSNQFSIKFLFGLTAVCAVLLGIGRGLTSTNASAVTFAGTMLLTLFPVLLLPFLTLSVRPSWRYVLLVPALWAALSWLAVEAEAATFTAPRSELAIGLLFLQIGAAVASLSSAIVLRLGGYVFCRPTTGKV